MQIIVNLKQQFSTVCEVKIIKKFTYCTRLKTMLLLLHSLFEHKTLRHSAAQSSSTECDRRELVWKRSFTVSYATSVSGLK